MQMRSIDQIKLFDLISLIFLGLTTGTAAGHALVAPRIHYFLTGGSPKLTLHSLTNFHNPVKLPSLMSQNKEASEFLSRVISLPKGPVSLDGALQPSLDDEAELRKLFATDKGNKRLKDTHVGLVDVFAAPPDIKIARARVIASDADRDAQHVMPLLDSQRRKEGSPVVVEDLEVFKKNWTVFTENSLSQLSDWSNVIAAGGSVQACLVPLPKAATASKKAMRKYYHNKAFPSSDVDLLLYGLTTQEVGR
jgi:hypothetical protein